MASLLRRRFGFGVLRVNRDRWVRGLPIVVLPVRAGRKFRGLHFRLGFRAFYLFYKPAPVVG